MSSVRSPWNSYRQVSLKTATPGQIILMLFEGAIRFLERAESGFVLEDPAEANETIHNNIHRAQEILHELNMALDTAHGGELAGTLRALYEYMDRRLMESDMQKSPEGVAESIRHLGRLREAWAQMLQGQGAPDPSGSILAAA
jgi:flagellar secretion chaperone FliS